MDWTGSKSDSDFFLPICSPFFCIAKSLLPANGQKSLPHYSMLYVGTPGMEMWGGRCEVLPKILGYGAYNGLQQHKYLPVTSDMLLTSPHNLRSEELSMAQLMWARPLDMYRRRLPSPPHALDRPTLLKVLIKMHSSFLDCCCLLAYL